MTSPDQCLPHLPEPPTLPGTISLRGPADVVATLPYHLGYQPTDSLVVIGLHSPPGTQRPSSGAHGTQLGFVARIDLPTRLDEVWPTADHVVSRVLAQTPQEVLLVAYESGPAGSRPSGPLSSAVRDLLRDAGVEVAERLLVRDGRFWSLDCAATCCPVEGLPVPDPVEVPAVADYVLLGRSPLRHRDELAGLIAPSEEDGAQDDGRRATVVELGRAFQRSGPRGPATGPRLVGRSRRRQLLRDWGLEAWRSLLTEGSPPSRLDGADRWSPLAPAPAAPAGSGLARPPDIGVLLAASLRDVTLRDLVITWLCPGSLDLGLLDPDLVARAQSVLPADPPQESSVVHRLAALCRSAPTGTAAAPLTVLANVVWWHGDGALASTALDLALADEPDYRLAVLLERMLDLAISPRRQPTT